MQQVNFLKSLPKKTTQISAVLIGSIVLATFAVLVLISLFIGVYQHHTKTLLLESKKQLISAQKDYEKISKDYPLLATDTPLVNQVQNLEQAYKAKRDEFESLAHLIVRRGFSEYMLGLAETTPNNLWLNEIHVNHDTNNITLSGYAIRPDAVSELIGNLLTSAAYKNVIFNYFFVKKIKNYSYMRFSIATKELGPEASKEEQVVEKTVQPNQKPKE